MSFWKLNRTFPPAVFRTILFVWAICGKWHAVLFPGGKEVNRLYFMVTAQPFDLSLITLDGYLQECHFQLFIFQTSCQFKLEKQKENPEFTNVYPEYGKHFIKHVLVRKCTNIYCMPIREKKGIMTSV